MGSPQLFLLQAATMRIKGVCALAGLLMSRAKAKRNPGLDDGGVQVGARTVEHRGYCHPTFTGSVGSLASRVPSELGQPVPELRTGLIRVCLSTLDCRCDVDHTGNITGSGSAPGVGG
jgi:hypothetical protein